MDKLRQILWVPLLLSLLLSANSCGYGKHDSRLEEIAGVLADSPQLAVERLDSFDPSGLREHDSHYYDFLRIKARDKAYMRHTTDSVIRDVIAYYSSHRGSGLYPEALYYGGRVSRDLGDYPIALRYFQDALVEIPDDEGHLQLRGCIVSQTGSLLNKLRLYTQAIPYIEESIRIDSLTADTFGLAHDHKLLGAIYMHKRELDSADVCFNKALEYFSYMEPEDRVIPRVYLAACQYYKGNIDSALMLIRGLPEISHPLDKNISLNYAARIYLQAGILDTAYMYAHELAYIPCANQKTGYQLLLSPELSDLLPPDSVRKYVAGYRAVMEDYLNKHESTAALIQNSYYNYSTHVRDTEKMQASKDLLLVLLFVALSLVAALSGAVLYLKYRNARQALHLRNALNFVSQIYDYLNRPQLPVENSRDSQPLMLPPADEDLRQQLLDRIVYIEQSDASIPIPDYILTSDLYRRLTSLIDQRKGIPSSSPLWNELEDFILTHSPNFKNALHQITNGRMTKADRQIALLIRFGVSPTGMSNLLNISLNGVASRRSNLGRKILGRNIGTKVVDRIILSL